MLCDNCGKREANVRYSENINGVKKQMNLCEECSSKLGITNDINFNFPSFEFSNLFGSFLEDFTTSGFLPLIDEIKQLKCDSCGYTFDDIINNGRYGCANCYDVFDDKMEPILKKLQGANRHVGRVGEISDNKLKFEENKNSKQEKDKDKSNIEKLEEDLKKAIKEERYEDAAKIRDELKKNNK